MMEPTIDGANLGEWLPLGLFQLSIPLSTLVKNNIDDFVLLTDILGGDGHDLVDDFGENLDVTMRITSYP